MVDSASIEISRRSRRAKTDRLDVDKLLAQLVRYVGGERTAFRVVRVPTEADEHRRHLHRELRALITDRRRVMNRIGGLLATQGIRVKVRMDFRAELPGLHQWNGDAVPTTFRSRLTREWEKVELVLDADHSTRARTRRSMVRHSSDPAVALVRRLLELRGLGEASAWLFVMELFAWRQFSNRRQVGAVTGLVPTPYKSGTLTREQGISKAGNRGVRTIAVQIAWIWVRYQRDSELTQWYLTRFAHGGPRARKVGHCRGRSPADDRPVAVSGRRRDAGGCDDAATEDHTRQHEDARRVRRWHDSRVDVSWGERPGGRSLVLTREPPSRWGRSPQSVPGATHLCFCARLDSADTDRRRVTASGRTSLMGPSSPTSAYRPTRSAPRAYGRAHGGQDSASCARRWRGLDHRSARPSMGTCRSE